MMLSIELVLKTSIDSRIPLLSNGSNILRRFGLAELYIWSLYLILDKIWLLVIYG